MEVYVWHIDYFFMRKSIGKKIIDVFVPFDFMTHLPQTFYLVF